jgi:hypothetical protein
MKFKTRRRKRREAIEEAKAKENKLASKPDQVKEQLETNNETKKKTVKEEKSDTKINLPPRRKTKQKNGK